MQALIITLTKNELRTDSRLLASLLDHRHRNIFQNVTRYTTELSVLGLLTFEEEAVKEQDARGVKYQKYAMLNEDQCYFILTLMRNNATVVKSKLALVKAFRDARNQLVKRDMARIEGKQVRITETDSIKQLVTYASGQGSKNAEMYYANITKMTNSLLGIDTGQRETLDVKQLKQVAMLDLIADVAIRDGIQQGLHYKDIYKLVKLRAGSVLGALGVDGGIKK